MIDTISKALGLVRQYNPLTVAPGALSLAENCVIRRENVIEPRRGFGPTYSFATDYRDFTFFDGEILGRRSTDFSYYDGSIKTITPSGGSSPPAGFRTRFVEAYSNLYVTTGNGPFSLSSLTSGVRYLGAPRSLDFDYTLTSGASGFLATGDQCAYRHLIKRIDDNDNVFFGYPSQRLWVTNSSGGAENVILTITLADDVVAGDVLQVYRTASATGTATDTSGDECGLVYEFTLTSTEISAGTVTFTDTITDTLIGANLYTNPSEEGIGQANARPPVCADMALYKSNFMFYANTSSLHRLTFALVGTTGLTGNTLDIGMAPGALTYNFGAAENVGTRTVAVGATGVTAVDIDTTARSLVRVINQNSGNTDIYAYYLSGPEDLPGQILLEARSSTNNNTISVVASNSTIAPMTFPESPVGSSNDAMSSTKDIRKNALFYSKAQQPEAVPLLNYLPVGPANSQILRIAPLRDSLIIISEAGVYRLTGEDPASFTVVSLDDTVRIKAVESVQVLANQVYALSNQGVIRISENGVEVISREIEIEMTKLLSRTNFENFTFSGSYESERLYLLSTLETDTSTDTDVTWVYNIFTRTWSKWTFGFQRAEVDDSADKIYYSEPGTSNFKHFEERKSFSDSDYADPEYILNSGGTPSSGVVTVTSSNGVPKVGDIIRDSGSPVQEAHITAVVDNGANSYTLTIDDTTISAWSGGVYIYPHIDVQVEWLAWTAKQPAMMKQVREVILLADNTSGENTVTEFDFSFRTNFENTTEYVSMDLGSSGYGSFWGGPWGGGSADTYSYKTFCPMDRQYANRHFFGYRHRKCEEKMSVAGLSIEFEMISEEVGK